MLIIKLISGLACIGSVAWFLARPDYDSAITIATSLTAFIAAWLGDKKLKRRSRQNQNVSKNGIGIQAGGNISMGNTQISNRATDAE